MKYIRELKDWEREITSRIISGGEYIPSLDNFRGSGVYLFPDGYYWYTKPWTNGFIRYFKGVSAR